MWPTVRDGDVLLVERLAAAKVGDVVVLDTSDGLLAHRLVAKDGRLIRCANARGELDPWVSADSMYGRVAGIERGGNLLTVGREPRGIRLLWALRATYGRLRGRLS